MNSMTIPNKRATVVSPVAWRTPPRQYGAWETVAGNITEGLLLAGVDNTSKKKRLAILMKELCQFFHLGRHEPGTEHPPVDRRDV